MVEYWDRLESLMGDGWDATRLAKELKVSYQAIKKVRDGGAFGSTNNFKAAKLFGVDPEWLSSGKGNKYPPAVFPVVGATEEIAKYAIAPVEPAQTAINVDASWLDGLIKALRQADPDTRGAFAGLLSALAQNPDNPRIITALNAMLVDAPVEAERQPVSSRLTPRPTESQLGWDVNEKRKTNRRA